jgi:hypothetical protein
VQDGKGTQDQLPADAVGTNAKTGDDATSAPAAPSPAPGSPEEVRTWTVTQNPEGGWQYTNPAGNQWGFTFASQDEGEVALDALYGARGGTPDPAAAAARRAARMNRDTVLGPSKATPAGQITVGGAVVRDALTPHDVLAVRPYRQAGVDRVDLTLRAGQQGGVLSVDQPADFDLAYVAPGDRKTPSAPLTDDERRGMGVAPADAGPRTAAGASDRAGKSMTAGDTAGALAAIDAGERLDPNYKNAVGQGWPQMRDAVNGRAAAPEAYVPAPADGTAPAVPVDLTTAEPREIDTELADLYHEESALQKRVESAVKSIRQALGQRGIKRRGYIEWPTTNADAVTEIRGKGDAYLGSGRHAHEVVAKYDAAVAALKANHDAQAPMHAEFSRRGGWTRFFAVPDGHIHRLQNCPTLHRGKERTELSWLLDMSGTDEDKAIAELADSAHVLCSVCVPNAPVLRAAEPPRRKTADELAAERVDRERKARAEDPKLISDVDGEPLVVERETIRTVRSAEIKGADLLWWSAFALFKGDPNEPFALGHEDNARKIARALSVKKGTTPGAELDILTGKAVKKIRKDFDRETADRAAERWSEQRAAMPELDDRIDTGVDDPDTTVPDTTVPAGDAPEAPEAPAAGTAVPAAPEAQADGPADGQAPADWARSLPNADLVAVDDSKLNRAARTAVDRERSRRRIEDRVAGMDIERRRPGRLRPDPRRLRTRRAGRAAGRPAAGQAGRGRRDRAPQHLGRRDRPGHHRARGRPGRPGRHRYHRQA